MSKLDKLIEESLKAEDKRLFADFGEQGFVGQIGGLFSGRLGWLNAITMAAQVAMFAGALYAASQLLKADDVVSSIRWVALFATLFAAMSVVKLMQWSQMQANRVIREIKRLELLTARGK
ncbi:MAG: hypothetical protein K2Q06_14560 [Parvularculaceae bacterium]|nr:hypothetical protein [Parvularculaceae bacterium]